MTSMTPSAKIREQIGHPLIDGDSHIIEYTPVLSELFPNRSVSVTDVMGVTLCALMRARGNYNSC